MKRKLHSGPMFRDFIVSVIKSKAARSYIEIGVRDGSTLSMVPCSSIGVDPVFETAPNPIGRKKSLHLFQMTSDDFFRQYNVQDVLRSPIDVVFLDGLHRIEYILRDFINSEKICHRDSVIMLDDCLPANAEMTERYHNPEARADQELAGWWTGDVWKMLPILRKYRPDLRITPVDVTPTGNVCVTNLDPKSTVLSDRFYSILDEYLGIEMDATAFDGFYDTLHIGDARSLMDLNDLSIAVGP